MKCIEISYRELSELPAIAKSILDFAGTHKVFAFYAPMGTGKTTLIKEICRQLGSSDNFSSPTYSIVNEYHIPGLSQRIYHIDLYRIKNLHEALDAGIEEYIESGSYCFIEWPELTEALLPVGTVKMVMKVQDNIRNVSIFINQ